MNLRKVLAVLLSVAMVASLIVMPVSSAAVNDTGAFEDILPTEGSAPRDIIYREVDAINDVSVSLESPADWSAVESMPAGGAVHFNFSSITGTTNSASNYIIVYVNVTGLPETYTGSLSMHIGVDKDIAIRPQVGGTWNGNVASVDTIDLTQGFELIAKHNNTGGNGTFDFWLKKAGEDVFTCTLADATASTSLRTTGITAKGNAVANIESATIYTAEEFFEVASFEELLPTTGEVGDPIYKSVDSVGATTITSTVDPFFTQVGSLPLNGALHYSFAGITGSKSGSNYITIRQDIEGSDAAGFNIPIGYSSSNMIQTHVGTSHPQIAGTDLVDIEKPFELIIKISGSTGANSLVDYWLKADGDEDFKLIEEDVAVGSNSGRGTSITVKGSPVANLTSATMYGTTVVTEIYTEKTFDEIITTSTTIGEYTYNSVGEIAGKTVSTSDTGFGKVIPIGGAVYYDFTSFADTTAAKPGEIAEDLENGGSLRLHIGAEKDKPIRIEHATSGTNSWDTDNATIATSAELPSLADGFELIVQYDGSTLDFWLRANGDQKFKLVAENVVPRKGSRGSILSSGAGTLVLASATMYEYVLNERWYTEAEILPKSEVVGETTFESIFEADAKTYSGAGTTEELFSESAIPVNGAVHYVINGVSAGSDTKFVHINEALANGGSLSLQIGSEAVGNNNRAIRAQQGYNWDSITTIATYRDIDLTQPFELIVAYDGSTLDFYLKRTGDAGFRLVAENMPICTIDKTSEVQIKGDATLDLASAKIYEKTTVQAHDPAFPESIDLSNYLLTFERDTDAQFAADTTLFTGTTISNGIATVAAGKLAWDVALPVRGVAHIRVSNATAANNCGLDIMSSDGARIRLVFHLSNNTARVYEGGAERYITLTDINLANPFDIIVQDTGSNINYWFAQTTDETYAITATYGRPTAGATNKTAIWSGAANNIMNVDFIRLYTPDFGSPIEDIITDKYFKLLETSGELKTEANDAQYDLPLNGAVLYKFDGFAAATTITLSNTARNGGLFIAFNQSSGNQIQVNYRENNSNPHISIASSSDVDTTKPFELLVVTSEETAEYFVKPSGKTKFTSLGEYALPLGTQKATSNTADVTSMTIYKYSNAPIVLTAGDDTAEVITNGTATGGAVRVLFNNNMAAKGKTVIFVGLTNEGAVKEGDFETRIIQENEEMIYLTDFASSTIKVFFWDNLVGMTPVDGFAPVIFNK